MLDYFSKHLLRNWTGRSEQSFGGSISIGRGEHVVLQDPFLLVGAVVCKPLFTSQGTLVRELTYTYFDSTEWVASLK